MTHDETERAGILERLGQSAEAGGEAARAEAALEEALAIRRAADDRSAATRTATMLASTLLSVHASPALVERIQSDGLPVGGKSIVDSAQALVEFRGRERDG